MLPILQHFGPWAVGVAIVLGTLIWHSDRKQLVAFYDAHTTAKQREVIASDLAIVKPLAEEGVVLAEQQFAQLPGAQKFVQATDHVLQILAGYGVSVPAPMIHGSVQKAFSALSVNGELKASAPKAATAPPVTPS